MQMEQLWPFDWPKTIHTPKPTELTVFGALIYTADLVAVATVRGWDKFAHCYRPNVRVGALQLTMSICWKNMVRIPRESRISVTSIRLQASVALFGAKVRIVD
jgi:hypothetical protein